MEHKIGSLRNSSQEFAICGKQRTSSSRRRILFFNSQQQQQQPYHGLSKNVALFVVQLCYCFNYPPSPVPPPHNASPRFASWRAFRVAARSSRGGLIVVIVTLVYATSAIESGDTVATQCSCSVVVGDTLEYPWNSLQHQPDVVLIYRR